MLYRYLIRLIISTDTIIVVSDADVDALPRNLAAAAPEDPVRAKAGSA